MVTIYVTSSQEGAGKTTLCAGLGKQLQKGKKIGYLKITTGKPDSDAAFMKKIFNLPEPPDKLNFVSDASQGNLVERVKQTHSQIATGKDVVIVEGLTVGASYPIAEALGAKVIVVESYSGERNVSSYTKFGALLLGVVLNKAPKKKLAELQSQASAELSRAGVNLLGVLPEDRTLIAPTIGELAELVQGKILSGAEKSAELVESFMLGAMTIDPGPLYYNRKSNKAVLVRSERPDMQMAALETPTRCLVLCGETAPVQAVLTSAKNKKVSIIQANGDIKSLAAIIEGSFMLAKFNQEKKLARLGEMMSQGFNLKAVAV